MATTLRRIHLSVHALSWLDLTPDDPRRKTRMWEQFPGRCEMSYRLEQRLKERQYERIAQAGDDEGVFLLPTGFKANDALIEFADGHLGPRSVVCRLVSDLDEYERILGSGFFEGVEQDLREAERRRGLPASGLTAADLRGGAVSRESEVELPAGGLDRGEIRAWMSSKAWAQDLCAQLHERGYSFDPQTVEFDASGEDWSYCAGVFPIQMGRAFGLAEPIERRFDLMNPDEGPVLLEATAVDQNLPMSEQVRLFVFEWHDAEGVRYLAQFWEGIRGIMDPPHVVRVDFPERSVQEVNLWGMGVDRAIGVDEPLHGRLTMSVGSGGQTPFAATLAMAQPDLPLKEFRTALLAGEVSRIAHR